MQTEERAKKRVSDSYTEHVEIVMGSHLNGYGRLFGGQLLQWLDVMFGVVARRHAGCGATTASIDHLEFLAPVYADDLVVLIGQVTWVGRCSMEGRVDTYAVAADGTRKPVNVAYAVMVALDATITA